MLVLRDNYYSSPLIIDEDEYLEKMFADPRMKEIARALYRNKGIKKSLQRLQIADDLAIRHSVRTPEEMREIFKNSRDSINKLANNVPSAPVDTVPHLDPEAIDFMHIITKGSQDHYGSNLARKTLRRTQRSIQGGATPESIRKSAQKNMETTYRILQEKGKIPNVSYKKFKAYLEGLER